MPFIKQNRYTVTPLKGATSMFTAYGVRSVPTEVIIDREGRAVAQVRLNNDQAEQTFQNLLENLLPPVKSADNH